MARSTILPVDALSPPQKLSGSSSTRAGRKALARRAIPRSSVLPEAGSRITTPARRRNHAVLDAAERDLVAEVARCVPRPLAGVGHDRCRESWRTGVMYVQVSVTTVTPASAHSPRRASARRAARVQVEGDPRAPLADQRRRALELASESVGVPTLTRRGPAAAPRQLVAGGRSARVTATTAAGAPPERTPRGSGPPGSRRPRGTARPRPRSRGRGAERLQLILGGSTGGPSTTGTPCPARRPGGRGPGRGRPPSSRSGTPSSSNRTCRAGPRRWQPVVRDPAGDRGSRCR